MATSLKMIVFTPGGGPDPRIERAFIAMAMVALTVLVGLHGI